MLLEVASIKGDVSVYMIEYQVITVFHKFLNLIEDIRKTNSANDGFKS